MSRKTRFTIYDMMDERGVFEDNSANPISPKYKGPIAYPKMMYSPKGEVKVTRAAEIIRTPMGPEKVGEQRELIHKIVQNEEEERALKALGWHEHPAHAIAASGAVPPPITTQEGVDDLEDQIEQLNAKLAAAKKSLTSSKKAVAA